MKLLPALALLLLASSAAAEPVQPDSIVIVDGDTVAIGRERIRLLDIDAPESYRPRCDAELVVGLRAKQRLADLLRAGPVDVQRSGKIDRYGRTLARIRDAAGDDVGAVLLAEGLAVPYRGGSAAWRERRAHWCGEMK